jgi:hypothetical protein
VVSRCLTPSPRLPRLGAHRAATTAHSSWIVESVADLVEQTIDQQAA